MVHLQLRFISRSVAVLFFAESVLASNGCSEEGERSTGLSAEDKGIIMGAQKLKKRKNAEAEKKAASKKNQ